MSKANNTKAIIFTVTLLSVMVMLIAGTIFYVYKDPVISETVASEQTVETTAETKAVREKRISVYGTSDIQGKIIDSSSGDKMTYQYRLAYMAKTFSDARTSGDYDDVLLVDAGDIYKGDPISNLSEGAALNFPETPRSPYLLQIFTTRITRADRSLQKTTSSSRRQAHASP